MNYKLMLRLLGRTLLVEAACLLLPLFVAFFYGEDPLPFLLSIGIVAMAGLLLAFLPSEREFFSREGFVVVSAIWLLFCLFGALPFFFSGYFASYIDCLFEISSGFTTTGATILSDVEILPRSILFWRSFSSWLGGMGVLIFTLAFVRKLGGRTHNLMRAESTGPVVTKLVPKTAESSKILYSIYIALTLSEILCLRLAGMPFFDAILHSFATVCTGGMSIKNLSIGAYGSTSITWVVNVFILLSSINFAIFFLTVTRRVKNVLRSDELRWFLLLVALATGLVSLNLYFTPGSLAGQSLGQVAQHALFQVTSVMSTTGFVTTDFNLWPQFSQMVLVLLMFLGGCAGSTTGGIKVSRLLLLVRSVRRDIQKISHPHVVKVVKLDGKAVDEETLSHVSVFFGVYMLIIGAGALVLSLDNFSFTTTVTAAISALSNIGPGLDQIGPMGNFSAFSGLSKVTLSLMMIIGRLELFPVLLLFSSDTWRHT